MKALAKSALVVAAMTATALVGVTGTANASIMVENQQLANAADSNDGPACVIDVNGSFIDYCGPNWGGAGLWNFESVYPDAPNHAYANVRIRNTSTNLCLTVLDQIGPGGVAGSKEVSPRTCNTTPNQEWASTRSAAGYLNYFNFQYRVCLDGGHGDTYGYPENGCNAHGENYYQDWFYLAPGTPS